MKYIVSTNPGGGYDTYARLIAKYMEGAFNIENIVIENIPGAGMTIGNNILYKAQPDGLTIGTFNAGFIYGQLTDSSAIQFEIEKFEWIGKASSESRSLIVSNQCEIADMADILSATEPVITGTPGVGSGAYTDIYLLRDALDLNLRFITGYAGAEEEMALMRGETCAMFATTSSLRHLINSGDGHIILTIGGKIEGVPTAIEYATTPRARKIIELLGAMEQLGRVTVGPPGIPPDRLRVLQDAYRAAVTNPDLVAEAERLQLPIEYTHGDEVKRLVLNALNQDPEIVQLLKDILTINK